MILRYSISTLDKSPRTNDYLHKTRQQPRYISKQLSYQKRTNRQILTGAQSSYLLDRSQSRVKYGFVIHVQRGYAQEASGGLCWSCGEKLGHVGDPVCQACGAVMPVTEQEINAYEYFGLFVYVFLLICKGRAF